jgi:hypothetical protein
VKHRARIIEAQAQHRLAEALARDGSARLAEAKKREVSRSADTKAAG